MRRRRLLNVRQNKLKTPGGEERSIRQKSIVVIFWRTSTGTLSLPCSTDGQSAIM
jgi:hypothetical protein